MYFLRTKARNFYPLSDRDLKRLKDQTNSSYEYQLCKMGFCYGLNVNEVMTLIRDWWRKHHIGGKIDRLLRKTLPNALEKSKPYIERYEAKQAAKRQEKLESKTAYKIIVYLMDREVSPAEIERDLELKHATVQMQLKRMIEKGLIEKRGRGKYRLVVLDETGDIDNLHEPGTTKIAFQKADHEAENPSIPPESTGTPIKRVQSMRLESSRQIVKKRSCFETSGILRGID
jgi:DNA-binding MarR family transcriptional regulator